MTVKKLLGPQSILRMGKSGNAAPDVRQSARRYAPNGCGRLYGRQQSAELPAPGDLGSRERRGAKEFAEEGGRGTSGAPGACSALAAARLLSADPSPTGG
jgi:hypothetical protein